MHVSNKSNEILRLHSNVTQDCMVFALCEFSKHGLANKLAHSGNVVLAEHTCRLAIGIHLHGMNYSIKIVLSYEL